MCLQLDYNVSDRIVQAIGLMYNRTHAHALTPDGNNDYFEMLVGVLHGDTLTPFLFTMVLDYTIRQAIDSKEEELGFKLNRKTGRRQLANSNHRNGLC